VSVQNKTTIKSYFETGDRPTEAQFADLIDSYVDTSAGVLTAPVITGGTITSANINGGNISNVIVSGSTIALTNLAQQPANTFFANSSSGVGTPAAVALAVNQLAGRGAGNIAAMTIGSGITVSANNTIKVGTTVSAATQAAQEAAVATNVYVSPGRQQYHPSAAKAWINLNGTGTPTARASYNILSITDVASGQYTLNFINAFSSAGYAMTGSHNDGAGNSNSFIVNNLTVSAANFSTTANAAFVDSTIVNVSIFGDIG